MKTTIELPDDLFRELKMRAFQQQRKLKDVMAEYLRQGLRSNGNQKPQAPTPVKLRGRGPLTEEEMEQWINWGRD